ncbi:FapA family protein [Candidatus Neomarinimicrobiota bacterium]
MSGINVARRKVALKNGVLMLTAIDDRRLVFGQVTRGDISESDVYEALASMNFKAGILTDNIPLLVEGEKLQVPLAVAELLSIPARTNAKGLSLDLGDRLTRIDTFPNLSGIDVHHKVRAGELLFRVEAPPRTVLRVPTGEERLLFEGENLDGSFFAGPNTHVDDDGKTIVSDLDGWAFRSIYGRVEVYGMEEIPGIGRLHGKVHVEGGLSVLQDIGEGSRVEIPGDLRIGGAVLSAVIEVGGNVFIDGFVTNPANAKDSRLQVGQSILTRQLDGFSVWIGAHAVILDSVNRCKLTVLDTLITPEINDSEIAIGHCLVVNNVMGESILRLGSSWIHDPRFRSRSLLCTQHRGRLDDIDAMLREQRAIYDKARRELALQFQHLRARGLSSSQKKLTAQSFMRNFHTMNDALETFKKHFMAYKESVQQLAHEEADLAYYRHLRERLIESRIVITGKLAPGVIIQAPSGNLTIEEEMSKVAITVNPVSGQLTISPLGE